MSGAWRWRRTSRPSSRSTCPERRWWSATGRNAPPSSGAFRTRIFLGAKFGEELASAYAEADVFVFPSLTDTFGLVIVEALACGTPVAAYPVTGPKDVIDGAPVGVLDNDLGAAALAALGIDRAACRRFAEGFSWRRTAEMLLERLAPIDRRDIERAGIDRTGLGSGGRAATS
jgi:DNA-directed RNA polymerase subunit N (RpoN/RPB10)